MPKAVIFDLDGTLVDSAPDVHAAANQMLEALDRPGLPLATVKGFIGNGVAKLVERCLDATGGRGGDVEVHALEHFHTAYGASPARLSRAFPGVDALLPALKAAGMKLAVCTNKPTSLSRDLMAGLGLLPWLDLIVGGDTAALKPDPASLNICLARLGVSAEEALYIGDSEIDAEVTARAGVRFWLFLGGYRRGPAEDIQAAFQFRDFEQLGPVILES